MSGKTRTFGKTPAAIALAERMIVLGDDRLFRRVAVFLEKYNAGLWQLEYIYDSTWRIKLALAWRDSNLLKVAFHKEINSYIKNLVHYYYRELVRAIE